MKVYGVCDQCAHKHPIDHNPLMPDHQVADWYTKHSGHTGVRIVFPERSPKVSVRTDRPDFHRPHAVRLVKNRRLYREKRVPHEKYVADTGPHVLHPISPHRLFDYLDNADIKIAYAASAQPTMTLASLAASSTLLGGRESTAIDNGASVKYLDYLAAGNYRAGAANNQAGSIYTCVVGARDDTPTWPDVFDGTDSAETVSKSGVFNAICKFLSAIAADNTASQTWYWAPSSVAGCFGGWVPDQFIYFVTHNIQTSTNVWSATEGDHAIRHTPVYATST